MLMPMLQPLRRQAHGCSTRSAKLHCYVVYGSLVLQLQHGWSAAIGTKLRRHANVI
jgi:hypothetical protein